MKIQDSENVSYPANNFWIHAHTWPYSYQELKARPLPQHKAIDYALPIARGLCAAHQRGIVLADWILRWTADGRALTYTLNQGGPIGSTNLWSQPVSGGPARQITHFNDRVVAYAWSPDGKQLAYTRATSPRDVVLFSNFR